MANIVIVFPREQDGVGIRRLLVRRGYEVAAVCSSGSAALQAAYQLDEGIMISGYRMKDMIYDQICEDLPRGFSMILLASERVIDDGVCEGVYAVRMPLKVQELLDQINEILARMEQERRRRRAQPARRSEADRKTIEAAKQMLMEKNGMTEEEAHRYLQKASMESGTNLTEMSAMFLRFFAES